MVNRLIVGSVAFVSVSLAFLIGCRIETVGDPNKPIKIEAHITVDIRKLKDTAYDIEDMVSGQKPVAPKKDSSMNFIKDIFGTPKLYAAEMNLRYSTPETDAAISSRRDRFSALRDLKQQGVVGEGNNGFVANLGGGGDVQAAVDAENRDRDVIYNAIVQQNSMAPADINVVRKTFAEVQRDKAESGDKIQLESGEWINK